MRAQLASVLLVVVLAGTGCGSRGDPRPPLRPLPPPLMDVRVAQRGTDAVLRFVAPPPVANVDGIGVPLERIELLVLAERYPVITPEILASSLERERRERLQAAREAAERAEIALARERAAAAAAEAEEGAVEEAVEEPEPEDEDETDQEALSPEQELLRRVPSDVRMAWRAHDDVLASVILESARRLERAVALLWLELGLPTAIIDQRRPPELPDPVLIIEAAERISRGLAYEDERATELFLESAAVVAAIDFEALEDYRIEEDIQIVHPVGVPAASDVRTRYYFAVRTVSERGLPGVIHRVAGLAPTPVPGAPETLSATVGMAGVELTWAAPATDIAGTSLEPEQIRYNVYRRLAADDSFPDTPLNAAPLEDLELLDTDVTWDETYVYEVRALHAPLDDDAAQPLAIDASDPTTQPLAIGAPQPTTTGPASTPIRESFGRASDEVLAVDTFPPPAVTDLEAVRAARTVTLRWRAVLADDLAGYRVYRHQAPAPEIPGLPDPVQDPDTEEPEGAGDIRVQTGEAQEEAGEAEEETGAAEEGIEAGQEEAAQEEAGEEDTVQEDASEEEGDARARRRQRRNLLLAAGWELLTSVPVGQPRFIDPSADPTVEWVYVVEAVDETGNAGPPATVTIAPQEEDRP